MNSTGMMNDAGGWMGGGMWFWPLGFLLLVAVVVFIVIRLTKK